MDSKFYEGKDENGKDKAEIVKAGASFASTHTSGTGPYTIESREQGVKVVFKRFKDHWDKDTAGNVDEIIMTPIKDNQTRVAALLSGDVDFIAPVAPNEFGQVESNSKVNLITMAGTRVITFQLNQERRKELKDVKVRQAIVHAINTAGIVKKIMRGFATTAGQMSPDGYLGYNKDLTPRFDLEKAKKLMSESGFPDGFTLTMMAPNNRYVNDEKIAQAVAAMLSKIKIKIDLKTMPKAQYWPLFKKRGADMQLHGWHADTDDSANFFEYIVMCRDKKTGYGGRNMAGYCNPKVDKLTLESGKETNLKKRSIMLQKVEQIIYDDAVILPLHWQNLSWAARKNLNIKPVS
jgi:peptide/nickel transport system substrate-binding protein